MSHLSTPSSSPKQQNHVLRWFGEEQFWQGVAAGIFSTGVLAIGALIAAVITGWVEWEQAIVAVISFVLVISVGALITAPLKSWFKKIKAGMLKKVESDSSGVSLGTLVVIVIVTSVLLVAFKMLGWGNS